MNDRHDRDDEFKRNQSPSNAPRRTGSASKYSGKFSRSDKPRSDRPRSDRSYSDKPRSDKPRSDRPYAPRTNSDRPRSDRSYSDKPRSDKPRSDRPYAPRTNSDRPRSNNPYTSKETSGDSDSSRRYGKSDRSESRSRSDFPRKFDTPRRFRDDEPRRERDQRIRGNAPVIDSDVTGDELGPELTAELKSLPVGLTISVAQHLAMSERYLSINSELALVHALHAKALAGRLACVREIVGVAYYANENWSSALNEFRAARRLAKSDYLIPMMADCERGLGKHDSALKLLISDEARSLTGIERIEAVIVEAGTRNDLKEHDAALLALKVPALAGFPGDMSAYARLCFVYAQTLEFLNRGDEAISWYQKADSADPAATSAGEKIADQDRTLFMDDLDYEL